MGAITNATLVIRQMQLGKPLVRRRNWQKRFVHLVGEQAVADQTVRSMLTAGQIAVADRSPDLEEVTYALTGATGSSEPATSAAARRSDGPRSHEAARAVGDIRPSQREVLNLFRVYGQMTQAELVHYAKEEAKRLARRPWSDSRYRSACAELERADPPLLVVVGNKPTGHVSRSGVPTYADVWDLSVAGRQVVGGPRSGQGIP